MPRFNPSVLRGSLLVPPLLLLSGCGGGDFEIASSLSRRPSSALASGKLTHRAIRVPTDEPFNLFLPTSSQSGGGKADARVDPAGTAMCTASCEGAGTAAAEFRIGYKFNMGSAPDADAIVKLELSSDRKMMREGEGLDTVARYLLWAFVKDGHGAVLKKATLSEGEGSTEGSLKLQTQFDLKLNSGVEYYLVIGGRATANGTPNERSAASVSVTAASVEIATRPVAPATRPAAATSGT